LVMRSHGRAYAALAIGRLATCLGQTADMKIAQLEMFRYTTPSLTAYKPGNSAEFESTIVRLTSDDGHVGWGEACPHGSTYQPIHAGQVQAGIELLAPAIIGLDPREHLTVGRAMSEVLNGTNEARAAIDIACWDLAGQASGRRVCDMMGGALADTVPTYFVMRLQENADATAAKAVELQDELGFTKLQLKAGDGHIDDTIATVKAVAAVRRPGTDLFVDVNRRWTVWQTIQFSEACAGLPFAIEQPCNTYAECADARPHLRHPLLLDECTADLGIAARAMTTGVANGFGMKITRIGGLTPMRSFLDLCRETNTPTSCDDSWGGDIIGAACVHAAATLDENLNRGAWIAGPYIDGHYDNINGPTIEGGRIAVPTGPGLGLTIADDFFGDATRTWT